MDYSAVIRHFGRWNVAALNDDKWNISTNRIQSAAFILQINPGLLVFTVNHIVHHLLIRSCTFTPTRTPFSLSRSKINWLLPHIIPFSSIDINRHTLNIPGFDLSYFAHIDFEEHEKKLNFPDEISRRSGMNTISERFVWTSSVFLCEIAWSASSRGRRPVQCYKMNDWSLCSSVEMLKSQWFGRLNLFLPIIFAH